MNKYERLKYLDEADLHAAYARYCAGRKHNRLSPYGYAVLDEIDRRLVEKCPGHDPKPYRDYLSGKPRQSLWERFLQRVKS
jgi:hypothetical protein